MDTLQAGVCFELYFDIGMNVWSRKTISEVHLILVSVGTNFLVWFWFFILFTTPLWSRERKGNLLRKDHTIAALHVPDPSLPLAPVPLVSQSRNAPQISHFLSLPSFSSLPFPLLTFLSQGIQGGYWDTATVTIMHNFWQQPGRKV